MNRYRPAAKLAGNWPLITESGQTPIIARVKGWEGPRLPPKINAANTILRKKWMPMQTAPVKV